jgi:hypothetical protein
VLKLRLTIPRHWRNILKGDTPELLTDVLLYKKLRRYKTLKSKDIYWLILYKNHDCKGPTNSHQNWKIKYNLSDENMLRIYTIPYISTKHTNLQSFQYKVIYKILNCNYWLHKIKVIESAKCRFCPELETIEHYFFSCKVTKQFWKTFITWWNRMSDEKVEALHESDIILGYIKDNNEGRVCKTLNCCLLLGKEMIYIQKTCNKQPDLYAFHIHLKDFILTERIVAINQNRLDNLIDEWGEILEI